MMRNSLFFVLAGIGLAQVAGPSNGRSTGVGSITSQFEVATIRVNKSGSHKGVMPHSKDGKFSAENVSLKVLIGYGYAVKDYQVKGSEWLESEQYDVLATLPNGTGAEAARSMLRSLLEERFHVQTHRETNEMNVYALVVGRGGPKFQELRPGEVFKPQEVPAGSASTFLNGTMARWGEVLSGIVGRPVVDKTGLTGSYMSVLAFDGGTGNAGSPEIFTAVQEELGLKLEAQRGSVDLLVVDHADKIPAEN